MKLNRSDIRRLIFEVLSEAPEQSTFNLREEVKNKIMEDHLARNYGVPAGSLETDDFTGEFGHYDWNSERFGSDILKLGSNPALGESDIPVMWIRSVPSSLSMPDIPHLGKDEINAIISTINRSGGTVDPERTGYELAVTATHRMRVKGSMPKRHLNIIYLKKV